MTGTNSSKWECGWVHIPFHAGSHSYHYKPLSVHRGDDKSEIGRLYVEVYNYVYMRPYCSMEEMGWCTPLVLGNDEK